jgi:hypothetical protein
VEVDFSEALNSLHGMADSFVLRLPDLVVAVILFEEPPAGKGNPRPRNIAAALKQTMENPRPDRSTEHVPARRIEQPLEKWRGELNETRSDHRYRNI